MTSKVIEPSNNSKPCLYIFIDLSKAFDKMSQKLLLHALNDIGIRNNNLDLFKTYLCEKSQSAKVDKAVSKEKFLNYRVP